MPLLAAGFLKAQGLVEDPGPGFLTADSEPILIATIAFEILLACWLVTGVRLRSARRILIACFYLFGSVALMRALTGEDSCGCFGRIAVSPWLTTVLDFVIATSVLLLPGTDLDVPRIDRARFRCLGAIAAVILTGGAITLGLGFPQASFESPTGATRAALEPTVLSPESWLGGGFPLIDHLEFTSPPPKLLAGKWLVVLYRTGCSHCRELVPTIQAWAKDKSSFRVAFLEVPPYGSADDPLLRDLPRDPKRFVIARLSAEREWFVRTPVLIELVDGVVRRLARGLDELSVVDAVVGKPLCLSGRGSAALGRPVGFAVARGNR